VRDTNVVTLVCRLTFDPELRALPSGTSVCRLRVAFTTQRKEGDAWIDKPNYCDVTVWGKQGEMCAKYLEKGRQVCVVGRLEWREWEDKESGKKRSAIDITADSVQFLGGGGEGGPREEPGQWAQTGQADLPADGGQFAPATPPPVTPTGDDDIPF
jgi:single-strand DNA-binding protein